MISKKSEKKPRIDKNIVEAIYKFNVGKSVSPNLLTDAFRAIFNLSEDELKRFGDVQFGILVSGLMSNKPTPEQIEALLRLSFYIDKFKPLSHKIELPPGNKLVAAVGSGKKGRKTINISTPACIIASSLGAYVAKPIWGSTSSLTGSADLMKGLGVKTDIGFYKMKKVLQKVGFGVFSIVDSIPNFERVYCGKFFAPTPFSFGLAALSCPVKYDSILYGLAHPNVELSAEVIRKFGVNDAAIVSTTDDGIHYIDEAGVFGKTLLAKIESGKTSRTRLIDPYSELGLSHYSWTDIAEGNSVEDNIKSVIDILSGKGDIAKEDMICFNTSILLGLAGLAPRNSFKKGYKMAKNAIKLGLPMKKLISFIKATGGDTSIVKSYIGR